MPKFMDFHDGLKLSSADIEQLRSQTQAGTTDEYGVRQLELYYNDAGKAYCLLEGLTRTQYGGTAPPSTFPAGRSTGSRPYFDPRPSPVALPGLDLVLRDLGGGGGPGEREGMW
jgi:hypothetical protein